MVTKLRIQHPRRIHARRSRQHGSGSKHHHRRRREWRAKRRLPGSVGKQVPRRMLFTSSLVGVLLTAFAQATVEDLDPPPALSVQPSDPISWALMSGLERDYTHLTVISQANRALLGYISIPRLQQLLKEGTVKDSDPVQEAMHKFQRRGRRYKVITTETPLEELEDFFNGGVDGSGKQEFAVVTDASRKFVLGVATRADLENFAKRRA